MFILKKIMSHVISPVPLIIVLILAGLFYLWFTKKQVWGRLLVSVGFIILLLLSNTHMSDQIIGYLESNYRPHDIQMSKEIYYDSADTDFIKYIVVLGGGHTTNPELPVSSQISESTMVRLVEGIRIYRKYLGSKLILSGGNVLDPVPNAVMMANLAQDLGVNKHDIIMESESADTKDEARLIKPIVSDEKFFLVTSAAHMPRSMEMFKKLGMNPIPAPAGHLSNHIEGTRRLSFFPTSRNLNKSQNAAHEYLGMIWASLRGQI